MNSKVFSRIVFSFCKIQNLYTKTHKLEKLTIQIYKVPNVRESLKFNISNVKSLGFSARYSEYREPVVADARLHSNLENTLDSTDVYI